MAEPSSTTAGAVAAATGVITLTGSIGILQYDALLFGLFGGLISLMHISAGTPARMAGSLATAALLGAVAALFAPAIVQNLSALNSALAWTRAIPVDPIRLAAALLVGIVAQVAIPVGLNWLKARAPGSAS